MLKFVFMLFFMCYHQIYNNIGRHCLDIQKRNPNITETATQHTQQPSVKLKDITRRLEKLFVRGKGHSRIVLEPLKLDKIEVNIKSNTLNFSISIKNIVIKGLGKLIATQINLSMIPLRLVYSVEIPFLDIKADNYSVNINIDKSNFFYAYGSISFQIPNITYRGTITMKLLNSYLYVEDMELFVSFFELKSHVTGIFGGGHIDELLNSALEYILPEMVKNNDRLPRIIEMYVMKKTNKFLKKYRFEDIVMDLLFV